MDPLLFKGIDNPDEYKVELAKKLEGVSLMSYAKINPSDRASHVTHHVYRLRTIFNITLSPQEVRFMEDAVDAVYTPTYAKAK